MIDKFKFVWQYYLFTVIFALTVAFFTGYVMIKSSVYLLLLNGLTLGVIVSMVFTYGLFFWFTLTSRDPYTPERQWITASGLLWAAVMFTIWYSVEHRSPYGNDLVVDIKLLANRYLTIISGIMFIFAPDMGKSLFFGVYRKVLIFSTLAGLISAIVTIIIQIEPLISFFTG
ncbi:MAG TPA: hypothetical protein PK745_00095 [bacterium]|nr:hypothetical protein [bacterium]